MSWIRGKLALFAALVIMNVMEALPLTAESAHDPVIIDANGSYYLFSTGRGVSMARSKDLLTWFRLPGVFSKIPQWVSTEVPACTGDFWAPDIVHVNGRYYLYYSASSFGSNRSCIGLATNTTLDVLADDYAWTDQGKVLGSIPGRDDWNAIDPALFIEDSDHWYLAFGSFWGGIKLTSIDPRTGKTTNDPPRLISLARRPGVQNDPIEAPYIYKKEGSYYLFASFDYCCRGASSNYKIAVGRSGAVAGPYIDRAGTGMLNGGGTVILESYGDVHGPGHCSIFRDGDKEYLVHHMYDGKHGGQPVLQVRPLAWSADGWPIVGEPLEAP